MNIVLDLDDLFNQKKNNSGVDKSDLSQNLQSVRFPEKKPKEWLQKISKKKILAFLFELDFGFLETPRNPYFLFSNLMRVFLQEKKEAFYNDDPNRKFNVSILLERMIREIFDSNFLTKNENSEKVQKFKFNLNSFKSEIKEEKWTFFDYKFENKLFEIFKIYEDFITLEKYDIPNYFLRRFYVEENETIKKKLPFKNDPFFLRLYLFFQTVLDYEKVLEKKFHNNIIENFEEDNLENNKISYFISSQRKNSEKLIQIELFWRNLFGNEKAFIEFRKHVDNNSESSEFDNIFCVLSKKFFPSKFI